jgi:hypothetical protein
MKYREPKEIEEKIRQGQHLQDTPECSHGPNYAFIDGVIAALDWVVNQGDDPFDDFQ